MVNDDLEIIQGKGFPDVATRALVKALASNLPETFGSFPPSTASRLIAPVEFRYWPLSMETLPALISSRLIWAVQPPCDMRARSSQQVKGSSGLGSTSVSFRGGIVCQCLQMSMG